MATNVIASKLDIAIPEELKKRGVVDIEFVAGTSLIFVFADRRVTYDLVRVIKDGVWTIEIKPTNQDAATIKQFENLNRSVKPVLTRIHEAWRTANMDGVMNKLNKHQYGPVGSKELLEDQELDDVATRCALREKYGTEAQ